jgi:Flp pilus assembly protein TadD
MRLGSRRREIVALGWGKRFSRATIASVVLMALTAGAVLLVWYCQSAGKPSESASHGQATSADPALDAPPGPVSQNQAPPRFIGTSACQGCHAEQYAAWRGSHHDRAMEHASAATVLGDFDDAVFEHGDVTTRFFRRGEQYFVNTEGPDGSPADFAIRYTFGFDPLQQYLIEFPDGRLQALSVAWDARPAEAGGQRWFHLYPGEVIDHRDELHWTGRSQNWNFMCADCHSTDLQKGYDKSTDVFATRWAELDVGCEACHGPASNHIAWAATRTPDPTRGLTVVFDQRREAAWTVDPESGNAIRSTPGSTSASTTSDREIEVCAQCHSRRAQIAEGYHAGRPFLDHYLPALIEPGLYHADGQQRDEVYVWGSFLQSRMHAMGVTCSDCHEPHSQTLRAPGDALCAQCHLPSKYASATHHFHVEGGPGSACVDCHMPATDYMVVDPRRDHGFRIPRPDLTASLGTPNACANCHADQPAEWAASAISARTGTPLRGTSTSRPCSRQPGTARPRRPPNSPRSPRPRTTRHRARQRRARAARVPVARIARCPARRACRPRSPRAARQPAGLESIPPEELAPAVLPLLRDPYRANRLEAVRLLAGLPMDRLAPADRTAFDLAAVEYVESLRYNADRPEARVALGSFLAQRGRLPEAERELRETAVFAPEFAPVWVNLADLYRAQGRDADAERVLREGLAAASGSRRAPAVAGLHHALGLTLVRLGRPADALADLARAAELAPDDPRFAYVYAVALNSAGQVEAALAEVDRGLRLQPLNRDLLTAGALFARDAGLAARARDYVQRLVEAVRTTRRSRPWPRRSGACRTERAPSAPAGVGERHEARGIANRDAPITHFHQTLRLQVTKGLLHRLPGQPAHFREIALGDFEHRGVAAAVEAGQ